MAMHCCKQACAGIKQLLRTSVCWRCHCCKDIKQLGTLKMPGLDQGDVDEACG